MASFGALIEKSAVGLVPFQATMELSESSCTFSQSITSSNPEWVNFARSPLRETSQFVQHSIPGFIDGIGLLLFLASLRHISVIHAASCSTVHHQDVLASSRTGETKNTFFTMLDLVTTFGLGEESWFENLRASSH